MAEHVSIVDGCIDNPRWTADRGYKCWVARVWREPGGGIARDFLPRVGRTGRVRLPANLEPGDVLELAGDILTGGVRIEHREYWFVQLLGEGVLEYLLCDTASLLLRRDDCPPPEPRPYRPRKRTPNGHVSLADVPLMYLYEELKRRRVVSWEGGYLVLTAVDAGEGS